jgi:hypothetical protein
MQNKIENAMVMVVVARRRSLYTSADLIFMMSAQSNPAH